ncbi:uncharacterized protein LOC121412439 [Lytechinus variegatus]|uniref:uncharacterized protein LOC121412439 n=1 Tax=Lytechinus variegatus TaxID=7654 RepID=UPI001BB2CDFC|nr:uncharacterized protein LOC121412439 [Lytechinus variegatus]
MALVTITRASLGRTAKLGALYDIRTETFLKDTLFASKLEDDMVDTMDLAETVIEMTTSDSLLEKCKKLNIEAELEVSVATGMVKLDGSGAFLGDEQTSARAQSMSLIYKLKTVNEEVMLRQNKDIIDKEILYDTKPDATHVVVGIDWGAQCTITCEYQNVENADVTTVREEINVELEKLKKEADAKGTVKVDLEDKMKHEKRKLAFKCRADVSSRDKNLPVTYEGAVDIARSLPTLVENTNGGKGVPVTYHLMPLENVRKKCKIQVGIENVYREIDEATIRRATGILEKVKEKRQQVHDIHQDMTHNCEYISDETLKKIDAVLGEVRNKEFRFKFDLQNVVKSIRSGKGDSSVLEEFLSKIDSHEISTSNYENEFTPYLRKVRNVRSMLEKGIKYVGKKDELVKDGRENSFVFYIPKCGSRDVVEKNRVYFMRLLSSLSDGETCQFIVADQEIAPSSIWPDYINEPTIEKYVNGMRTSEDLYKEEGKFLEMCMIQVVNPHPDDHISRDKTIVKIRCPNTLAGEGSGCIGDPDTWICSNCKQTVEYGTLSKMFYCRCGKSKPKDSYFRCNDPHHGMDFVRYPEAILHDNLSRLEPVQEMNILILGETGVGKSTWINGFQNYLKFANLTEAMETKEFDALVPSSFILTKDDEQREINIGTRDRNEEQEVGSSATKEPRSYVFKVGDKLLRLIDTPGIGDTGGIEQDKINMNKILSYLTYFSQLHAICILLEPNKSRLTPMFRFCIQELLVQLHNSAKNNIVFCFTHARQTFYQPGDTLPALNKELENRNVGIQVTKDKYFCFDNEPFRFLACIKNGVMFNEADIATYSSSWDRSVEETMRLLKYVESELTPHNVKETIGMNEARRIILAMGKPLAEVANTINQNVEVAREITKIILKANNEISTLKEVLKFKGYDVSRKELNYPRTVCASPKCISYVPVGNTMVQNTVYETICHSHCHLPGVPIETTNNIQLYNCQAMTDGTCDTCQHSYKEHMHITYDLVKTETEFLSPKIQSEINRIRNKKSKIQTMIHEINNKIEELKVEEKIIMETAAKFGSFLKSNALIPYNDAVDDYLDMCIKQEEAKQGKYRNETILDTMRNTKQEYNKQREILDIALKEGANENVTEPEHVKELQENLFQLKHFGATLRKFFQDISLEHTTRNLNFEEKIVPSSSWTEDKTGSKFPQKKKMFQRFSDWSIPRTLVKRAHSISDHYHLQRELDHIKSTLVTINGYPPHKIKTEPTPSRPKESTKATVILPYIGPTSHKLQRIFRAAKIEVRHRSSNKSHAALYTHKDTKPSASRPGVP